MLFLEKISKSVRFNKSRIAILVISLIVLVGISSFDIGVHKKTAQAGVSHNVSGYVWSDTIGWISFNCKDLSTCGTSDYGVGINESTGDFFGYAWSSNIGWITFNESELSGCPSGACKATLTGSSIDGWAKALSSSDPESGGWDGWISLSGSNYGVTYDSNSGEISGYGWGSAIIGWLDFNATYGGVIKETLTASLTVSEPGISGGQPVTLTWTSTIATECTGTNFSTSGATSGNIIDNPDSTTSYTLSCSNDFDSVEDIELVQVYNTECTDGVDNDSDGDVDLNDAGCSGIADDNESSSEFVVMSISGNPELIQTGGTTTISWSAGGVNSCSVTGTNGDSWQGISGSQQTSAISEQAVYTLACLDVEDHTTNPETVTISLVPIFLEF